LLFIDGSNFHLGRLRKRGENKHPPDKPFAFFQVSRIIIVMEIRFAESAFKHHIPPLSIIDCLAKPHIEYIQGEEPLKILYVGFDNNARPLEVAAIIEDNIIKVIHAMKLQKKDYHLLEGLHAES
jgi:hypothetical protein